MLFKSTLIFLMASIVVLSARAEKCTVDDTPCWGKNAANTMGHRLTGVKVLKDFSPEGVVQVTDAFCRVTGANLTAGMSTEGWRMGTQTPGWWSDRGLFTGGVSSIIPSVEIGGFASYISISCWGSHWIQPEQIQEAVAGFLELTFN